MGRDLPVADPYAALANLAEREAVLIAKQRLDELSGLADEREALVARMPAAPPPEARAHLVRAAELQEANGLALALMRSWTLENIVEVQRGRRASAGYTPTAGGGSLLDQRAS